MSEHINRTLYGRIRELEIELDVHGELTLTSHQLDDEGQRRKGEYEIVVIEDDEVRELLDILIARYRPIEAAEIRERVASTYMHEATQWTVDGLITNLEKLCHFVLTGQRLPEKVKDDDAS